MTHLEAALATDVVGPLVFMDCLAASPWVGPPFAFDAVPRGSAFVPSVVGLRSLRASGEGEAFASRHFCELFFLFVRVN